MIRHVGQSFALRKSEQAYTGISKVAGLETPQGGWFWALCDSSFGLSDLPTAIRVLQLAQAHVESKEAETA
jgi:hypothetical protein